MSARLDNLIAILQENTDYFTNGDVCASVNCNGIPCHNCPFNDEESVNNLVEELEVLQHAKA